MRVKQAKPCPFCGGTHVSFSDGTTYRWISCHCTECDANTGDVRRVGTYGNPDPDADEARALAVWNTRPGDANAERYRKWKYLDEGETFDALMNAEPDEIDGMLDALPPISLETATGDNPIYVREALL